MVIAIDGPAGAGKSTISKCVAERCGFQYLNSGNFYRAITWKALRQGVIPEQETEAIRIAQETEFDLKNGRLLVDGEERDSELHTDEVDRYVSQFSASIPIRHRVNECLRKIAEGRDIVVEGRDISTVVFPDAAVKVYLDASIETRAKRRLLQGTSVLSLEELKESIAERDTRDREKHEGALMIAEGAFYLDTSDLTIEQVCEKVVAIIPQRRNISRSNMVVMTDNEQKTRETPVQNSLQEELQEHYLKNLDELEEGRLVEGKVVEISPEHAFLDVGYKSEGKVPLSEFIAPPKVGDVVQVVLLKKENRAGEVIVSKQRADEKLFWKKLRNAFQEHTPIEGKVAKAIKGGFEIDLGYGILGFNPISKIDIQRVENPEQYVGLESKFLIERLYNEKRVNIVLSRRAWMEKDIAQRKAEFFEKTQIGDEVEGVVKSFTSFGAFIDLGGFDGLLHVNDMSWGHVTRPKDYVKKGETIRLKVVRLDKENQKINLSLKHFTEDPWVHFEEKYHVGDIVKGKVTKLADFGAFIELEEGIEGLVHISEFSWVKRIKHPKEVLQVGDEVETMILGYDIHEGRISLGLKQVYANPWDSIPEKYPVGMRLTRPVRKITNAGVFIELEEGIDGFLHVDDLSWTKKIKNPSSMVKEGEEIEVMVLDVIPEERNIRLGVKQLSEDPWASLKKAYPEKSVIEGVITNITDFGIFVKVQGDIEGLVNKANIPTAPGEPPEEAIKKYAVGDTVNAVVLEINPSKHRLSLSLREYAKKQQREELKKYIHDEGDGEATFTLGDFLKEKNGD
ncbi:MAG: 30S ribosomal protein S1 [Spirochaetales bacterium]|nr:30S ribosomal protein S1 [Spirochaetales bacterium]